LSKPRAKRPSPSLVISILALFIALGGSAYAASKVGTKDIKKNAITAKKIKKNAVTTAKIMDDAVTGAKVAESTLGVVPNAAHADRADSAENAAHADRADSAENAVNATNAVNAANFTRFGHTGILTRSHDDENFLSLADGPGPFSFDGFCLDSDGDDIGDTAYVAIKSSEAGAYVFADPIFGAGSADGKLPANAQTPISDIIVEDEPNWGKGMGEFTASTHNGSMVLHGFVNVGTHVFGGECAYEISWFETQ
jgi:hypothetical protein